MRWEHEKGNKKIKASQTRRRRRGQWFTIDLEECALLDTVWLTEKSYETKRVHSVMCSDTKGHSREEEYRTIQESTHGKKVQRMWADSSHSPTRQTALETGRAVNLGNALSLGMKWYHVLVICDGAPSSRDPIYFPKS